MLWAPAAFIVVFGVFLFLAWGRLDGTAAVGIISVLAGGLAGVVGSFASSWIASKRVQTESVDRLKDYASSHALELTKLELELRRKTGRKQMLAPAKIYREFHKALLELYSTGNWPKAIEENRLLDILDFPDSVSADSEPKA